MRPHSSVRRWIRIKPSLIWLFPEKHWHSNYVNKRLVKAICHLTRFTEMFHKTWSSDSKATSVPTTPRTSYFLGDDRIAQCFAKYSWVQINKLLGISGLVSIGKVYLVLQIFGKGCKPGLVKIGKVYLVWAGLEENPGVPADYWTVHNLGSRIIKKSLSTKKSTALKKDSQQTWTVSKSFPPSYSGLQFNRLPKLALKIVFPRPLKDHY